jgi:hypothetical protein
MSGVVGQSKKGERSLSKATRERSFGRQAEDALSWTSKVYKAELRNSACNFGAWFDARHLSRLFTLPERRSEYGITVRPKSLGYCGRKWRCWWEPAKVYPKDLRLASVSGYTERSDEHRTVALQYCCWNKPQLYRSRATGEIPGWCNSSVSPQ